MSGAPFFGMMLGGWEIILILCVTVVAVALGGVLVWLVFRLISQRPTVPAVPPLLRKTSEPRVCARCGSQVPAGAPEGLCPRCVMGVGLGTEPMTAQASRIPDIQDIARHFPDLKLEACLGRGGMGVVYRARQIKLNRLVALKILGPEHRDNALFQERFHREAQALAQMNHPHIVAVYDYGETGGHYFLLMEYVEGMNLRQLLRTGKLSPEVALPMVAPICDALQYAHQRGIVHRDIKPENILLDRDQRIKIADFGIARIVGATRSEALTAEYQVVGTPHYMAPEQVEQPSKVDHRADIYSLGVVIYEMLTGELPLGRFSAPSVKATLDVRLDEVVLHALEKEPERRYQHATEVKTRLAEIAADPQEKSSPALQKVPPVRVLTWRDLWLWDKVYTVAFAFLPLFLCGLLIPLLFPLLGGRAWIILILEGAGLVFSLVYAVIGAKVRRLRRSLPSQGVDVAEALIVRGARQSPGLAVLHRDRLETIPIQGDPMSIEFHTISTLSEVRWFNGTRLWWKRGLVLQTLSGERLRIAIPEPFARDWRAILSRGVLPTELPPRSLPASDWILLLLFAGPVALAAWCLLVIHGMEPAVWLFAGLAGLPVGGAVGACLVYIASRFMMGELWSGKLWRNMPWQFYLSGFFLAASLPAVGAWMVMALLIRLDGSWHPSEGEFIFAAVLTVAAFGLMFLNLLFGIVALKRVRAGASPHGGTAAFLMAWFWPVLAAFLAVGWSLNRVLH